MRWFFILLLLGNLVYLGWEIDRQAVLDRSQLDAPLVLPPGTKKLVMLRELPAPPPSRTGQEESPPASAADDAGGEAAAPVDVRIEEKIVSELLAEMPAIRTGAALTDQAPAQGGMCFSYGPFPDAHQGRDLIGWFEERHISVQQRPDRDSGNRLFWIYLAPSDSLDSAMRTIEELKQKGVGDYKLIQSGDLRHAISLGLFSTQARVNHRLNELKGKGYRPIVVPYRDAPVIYWVDVKLNQQQILQEMFTGFPARFNSIPVECGKIASAGDPPIE